jgi:hypothetical protein
MVKKTLKRSNKRKQTRRNRRRGGVSACAEFQNQLDMFRNQLDQQNEESITDLYGAVRALYDEAVRAHCPQSVLNEIEAFENGALHQKMEELLA